MHREKGKGGLGTYKSFKVFFFFFFFFYVTRDPPAKSHWSYRLKNYNYSRIIKVFICTKDKYHVKKQYAISVCT